jgi:hypothetical protein
MAAVRFLATRRLRILLGLLGLFAIGLAPAAAKTDAMPKSGKYAGKSAQGAPVSFRVRGKVVSGVRFRIRGDCSFGVDASPATGRVGPTGSFKVADTRVPGFRWTVKGRFTTPTRAAGTILAQDVCPSAPVIRFNVRRVS